MDIYTLGVKHYPEAIVPMACCAFEDFSWQCIEEYYKIVIVEEGTGFVQFSEFRELVSAPAILCFNELELPDVERSSDFKARSVYFHPSFINSAFTFKNIREGSEDFLVTDNRDRHWLRPFFVRYESYNGMLSIGYVNLRKVQQLFDTISLELLEQRDGFWPCRSRSYLLELLLQIERAFMEPKARDEVVVSNISEEIGKVVLYLHTNYHNKITLDDLAKEFHINRTTLNKHFNEEIGVSIMTYLIKLRISLASALLRDTMVPVVEIMERTGFKDPAHFLRMFRKNTGCSPSEYRQQNCWLLR